MKTNYVIKKDALGRTLFCCPKCERPLITFYKNAEPIKATGICECGEKVYFVGDKQKSRDLELEVYEELCVGCSDEKICHEECEHCVQFYERLEEKENE